MSHQSEPSELTRRARDSGRVNRAWRWFSDATIRTAESYRDLRWRVVTGHIGLAALLVILSLINPTLAVSPWLLVIGVIWMAYGVRMGGLKAIGQATAQPGSS